MFVVQADFIQRMAPDFIDELCLAGIRLLYGKADIAAASLIAPALVMTVLYFTVIMFSLIRVNRDDVAVIRQRAGVEIARHILNNVEADKMAAGWLCIRNEPLHLVIHFLGDAGL